MLYKLTIHKPRPYFAELPYYLWSEVNYKSDGNCRRPTDQRWTFLDLTNRDTHERMVTKGFFSKFTVVSDIPELAARTALFLIERSEASVIGDDPRLHIGSWSHTDALARTHRIREEFSRPELKPFDSHLFWGSWKWVGWFATDFTWVGRWIMNAVLTQDTRAVFLCIQWLRDGTFHRNQSAALRSALSILTKQVFRTDKQWIDWYDTEGQQTYPEPDFQKWLEELKCA